jgi:hypothetical protein
MTSPDEAWIGSASRQAALAAPVRDLHRAVLRRFLDTGTDVVRMAAAFRPALQARGVLR